VAEEANPDEPDRKPNLYLAILKFVVSDLALRSTRPIAVIAFMAYFVLHFMPTDSAFVWLVFFLSSAGVWYVMGAAKTALDRVLSRKVRDTDAG
jgi:hypothetical protein